MKANLERSLHTPYSSLGFTNSVVSNNPDQSNSLTWRQPQPQPIIIQPQSDYSEYARNYLAIEDKKTPEPKLLLKDASSLTNNVDSRSFRILQVIP